jgi:type IV pilus assembly protein PilN
VIRINLLPNATKHHRGAAASAASVMPWVIAYAAAGAVTVVVAAVIYFGKEREHQEQLARNAALEARIAELTQQSAQIEEVRAQLQRSQELERVVRDLQRARFGPTRVLMELSRILSVGGGPTIDPERLEQLRRRNPLAGYNRSWDPRRLWLTVFDEEDRAVRIRGFGRTNEDVAEFLRRLSLSEWFDEVQLERSEQVEDEATHLLLVGFELSAKVRY